MIILNDQKHNLKHLRSKEYNYKFNTETGHFVRWGKTLDDDPEYSKFGPEILDLEVSTICSGIGKGPCSFCYKANTPKGEDMSFETFKTIFDKMPKTLTQIAFGIGNIWQNKDLLKMWDYCRNNEHNPNVIPNVTINGYGLTDEWVNNLKNHCGAVAVSVYDPKDVCYDAVKKLTDAGMDQINIHCLVSEETFDKCKEVVYDAKNDPRLARLNAVVFLTLKPKGKRNKNTGITSVDRYRELIDYTESLGVSYGFDSCSAPTYLKSVKHKDDFDKRALYSESCESTLFSSYINVKGDFYPCSFTEDEEGWETGLDVVNCSSFMDDVWNHEKTIQFRNKNLGTTDKSVCGDCRSCVTFPKLYGE